MVYQVKGLGKECRLSSDIYQPQWLTMTLFLLLLLRNLDCWVVDWRLACSVLWFWCLGSRKICRSFRCDACCWCFRTFDDAYIHQHRNDYRYNPHNWIAPSFFKLWWLIYGGLLPYAWYGSKRISSSKFRAMIQILAETPFGWVRPGFFNTTYYGQKKSAKSLL